MPELEFYKNLYYQDKTVCFKAVLQEQEWQKCFLQLFLALAGDTHTKYKMLGIDEAIYIDTMSDIEIWRGNCKKQFGIDGLAEYRWLKNHIDMKLFRLGRLQFMPMAVDGEIVLDVHIPQGEALNHDGAAASYKAAFAFFRGITNRFVCSSWLLSPKLKEVLPEGSNIIKFQNDYEIETADIYDRQCEQRVFHKLCDDPAEYPADTQLQQKIRSAMLRGEKFASAKGGFLLASE